MALVIQKALSFRLGPGSPCSSLVKGENLLLLPAGSWCRNSCPQRPRSSVVVDRHPSGPLTPKVVPRPDAFSQPSAAPMPVSAFPCRWTDSTGVAYCVGDEATLGHAGTQQDGERRTFSVTLYRGEKITPVSVRRHDTSTVAHRSR